MFCPLQSGSPIYGTVYVAGGGWHGEDRSSGKIYNGVEMQGSFSKGKTPLWLNANKHGLSSLEKNNGYLRGSLVRPLSADSARRWAVGIWSRCGSTGKLYQPCSGAAGLCGGPLALWCADCRCQGISDGAKNQSLSSGSQCLGINARPIPQVRLALPEYWTLPFGRGWLQLKGHLAYGMTTDDGWQHDFTKRQTKYCDHMLYHSKAGFSALSETRMLSVRSA